jgi:hypothetical protein
MCQFLVDYMNKDVYLEDMSNQYKKYLIINQYQISIRFGSRWKSRDYRSAL